MLLVAGVSWAVWLRRDPQDDVDALVARLRIEPVRAIFLREGAASIGVFPGRGWTLTVFVGDTKRYAPAHFLVIKRLDRSLIGEMLLRPADGADRFQQLELTGAALSAYLVQVELDVAPLDQLIATGWTARNAGR